MRCAVTICSAAIVCAAVSGVAAQGSDPGAGASAVATRAWVSADDVQPDSAIRVWTEVRNGTQSQMHNLSVTWIDVPGFVPVTDADCANSPAACFRNAANGTTVDLEAGETALAVASFKRVKSCGFADSGCSDSAAHLTSGKVSLSGVVTWSQTPPVTESRRTSSQAARNQGARAAPTATQAVDHSAGVTAGPVNLPSDAWQTWPVLATLKDLALPIVLAVLAWRSSSVLQKRTETNAVWTELLQPSLTHAKEAYLPLAGAASRLSGELEKRAAVRTEFYLAFLIFNRKIRVLSHRLGGFHFKSKSGEIAISAAWNVWRTWQNEIFGEQDITAGVDLLKDDATIGQLLAAYGKNPAFTSAVSQLQARWTTRKVHQQSDECAEYALKAFQIILQIESDRPFERWYLPRLSYLDSERLKGLIKAADSAARILKALAGCTPDFEETANEFDKRVRRYIGELPLWRRGLIWWKGYR